MILVDTSVWIDHLRADNALLAGLLNSGRVLMHPFVIGELAWGRMRQRDVVLASLLDLPRAGVATDAEVLRFIDRPSAGRSGHRLRRCPLACGVRLKAGAELWTKDARLRHVAEELAVAMKPRRF